MKVKQDVFAIILLEREETIISLVNTSQRRTNHVTGTSVQR